MPVNGSSMSINLVKSLQRKNIYFFSKLDLYTALSRSEKASSCEMKNKHCCTCQGLLRIMLKDSLKDEIWLLRMTK